MESKWIESWRSRWAYAKRLFELGVSGLLLVSGVLLALALTTELPGMVWGTLTGDGEAASTLFIFGAGVAVSILQWRWRAAFYPQLRRDAKVERHKKPAA